jgi:hypothetical protein
MSASLEPNTALAESFISPPLVIGLHPTYGKARSDVVDRKSGTRVVRHALTGNNTWTEHGDTGLTAKLTVRGTNKSRTTLHLLACRLGLPVQPHTKLTLRMSLLSSSVANKGHETVLGQPSIMVSRDCSWYPLDET